MRFHRIDLIKYGKFTDRTVNFPQSNQDFHLVMGANEAGKSTLRSAIVDLLFGIPARSQLNFLHPHSELRLGALISDGSNDITFHRTKANKQTIRKPTDEVLPDTALHPFVGAVDRHFFEQMFGLDHARLVDGGNSILNAQSDVGQILFQSAAGIASLGKIRDVLAEEAEKLWTPRYSKGRSYYIASDQLNKATAALKDATVRTKEWVDANNKVESISEALTSERSSHAQLQINRTKLERIRRLAPCLAVIRDNESKLAELGQVTKLPTDAEKTLESAKKNMDVAQQLLEIRVAEAKKLTDALGLIQVDDNLLAFSFEIDRLNKLRVQYSAYSRDIAHRENEISVLWQEVCNFCNELGWKADSQESVSQRLPGLLLQRELRELANKHGGLAQTLRSSEQAEKSKAIEIDSLEKQLEAIRYVDVNSALRAALAKAKSLGDTAATTQKQQAALNKAQLALESLMLELGQWRMSLDELKAMQVPDQQKIARLLTQRQNLVSSQKAELAQLQKQKDAVDRLQLEITQFKTQHNPSTHEMVMAARRQRDDSWQAIKAGEKLLQLEASNYEATVSQADTLADNRLNDVEAATRLQHLHNQVEQEQQSLSTVENKCSQLKKEIEDLDGQWAEQTKSLSLVDMPLEDIGTWLLRRDKVLAAATTLQETQHEVDLTVKTISEVQANLTKALQESGLQVNVSDELAVLCIQAESHIKTNDDAKIRQETLTNQLQAAKTQVNTLQQDTEKAKVDLKQWSEAWSIALNKAGLPHNSGIATVDGSLELIGQIEEKLKKIKGIQVERVDAMNADLSAFAMDVNQLAPVIAPDLKGLSPDQIMEELANRLTKANEAKTEMKRLQEGLQVAELQISEAKTSIQTETAGLKHLLEMADSESIETLAEVIKRSDEFRRLKEELTANTNKLISDGDGLTRSQIETEIESTELNQLIPTLENIKAQVDESVSKQSELSAQLSAAEKQLSEIGGSDAAMQAEAQRQEALAAMSDAAERYIKVQTAQRLLRWAIDRYREEKQGPLLARASSIFATLTSGSFQKLVVDYDREPMSLEGQRTDGKLVGISGLSDGTRDQLYMALRLAALEMHLEQAVPLPFIADDLFINYDDRRAKAGLEALKKLSEQTQVIFLSHHDHLIPTVETVFGKQVNTVHL